MTNEKTSRLGCDATYLFCSLNSFWHIFRLAVCRFVWSIKMKNKFDGEKIILFLSIRLLAFDSIVHTNIHVLVFSTCYLRCMHSQGDRDLSQSRTTKTRYVRVCVLRSTRSRIIDHETECEKNDVRTRTAFTLANGQFVCVAHMLCVSQTLKTDSSLRTRISSSSVASRLNECVGIIIYLTFGMRDGARRNRY